MIGLTKEQEIFDRFQVQSKLGSGVLYLLNTGIVFEVSGKGPALELHQDEITVVKEIKKETLLISWAEGTESYDLKINAKNASTIVQQVTNARNKKY